jgi:hypothetical protein
MKKDTNGRPRKPENIFKEIIAPYAPTQTLNNKHGIDSRIWDSMTIFEKSMFNMFMDYLCKTDTQFAVRHEDMAVIDVMHWYKFSYNISLRMAEFMSENLVHVAAESIMSAQFHIMFHRLINHYEALLKTNQGNKGRRPVIQDNLERRKPKLPNNE